MSGGSIDSTPAHLIDLTPTLLDVAGAAPPSDADLPGTSLIDLLGEDAPERMLFFEHEGHRAVRAGKWKLVALREQPWELYDTTADRTETLDISQERPEVVRRLSKAWDAWAHENHVTPLPDDYRVEYVKPRTPSEETRR